MDVRVLVVDIACERRTVERELRNSVENDT